MIGPLEELVNWTSRSQSPEVDDVENPAMGAGDPTTIQEAQVYVSKGIEAVKAGRRFVGIELKESYWKQACANLEAVVILSKQKNLFGEED